jgi:hypothetical protein
VIGGIDGRCEKALDGKKRRVKGKNFLFSSDDVTKDKGYI